MDWSAGENRMLIRGYCSAKVRGTFPEFYGYTAWDKAPRNPGLRFYTVPGYRVRLDAPERFWPSYLLTLVLAESRMYCDVCYKRGV